MSLTIENQLKIIRDALSEGNFNLLEVSGSFRAELMPGLHVYIYPETFEKIITARFDTRESDPDIRTTMSLETGKILGRVIDFAEIRPFVHSDTQGARFVYTARIDIKESEAQQIDSRVAFQQPEPEPETPVEFSAEPSPASPEPPGALSPAMPLEPPGPLAPPDTTATDLVERAMMGLEGLDAAGLRELLDQMYLKRSGKVRVAINRVFRCFTDRESIEEAIVVEAKKIISPADREELQIARSIDAGNPLEPLIELIYDLVFGEKQNY